MGGCVGGCVGGCRGDVGEGVGGYGTRVVSSKGVYWRYKKTEE